MNYSHSENNKRKIKRKSKVKKLQNKVWLIFVRVFLAVMIIASFSGFGAVFGAYLGILENTPKIDYFSPLSGDFTTIVYLDSTGEEIDRFDGGEDREYAEFENIPDDLKNAFIAIEDKRFYEHNGIDLKGMVRALQVMLTSDKTEGASTITQQLIKNKLELLANTPETKIQEQYLAIKYEETLTEKLGSKMAAKDYILSLYLNAIGLGEGQVGVQAAANFYFNKDVSDLTLSECAVIAATTQKPTYNSPLRHPENNVIRRDYVLEVMLEMGTITQAEHDQALAEDPYGSITAISQAALENASYHSYYIDEIYKSVRNDLMKQKGLNKQEADDLMYKGGLSIYSAQDMEMQAIVDREYLNEENFPDNEFAILVEMNISVKNNVTDQTNHFFKREVVKNKEMADAYVEKVRNDFSGLDKEIVAEKIDYIPQPQSAFIVIDNATGFVKAIAGGRGEKLTNRAFNRATDALRQPGSVFKILASYAPALDMGLITPASIIDDTPFTVGNYSPSNWDSKNAFRGLTTVREAIKDSMNICAVKNMYETGVDNCLRYVENFGFKNITQEDYNLSTALGGIYDGVSPLEIAAAYAAIANQGIYNEPKFYTKVLDHEGNLLLDNTNAESREVIKKTTAYELIDMMKDVVKSGTGTDCAFREISMPLAGKTGTTSFDKDYMFAGCTPYYTSVIWLGYDLSKQMTGYGTVHKKLWRKITEEIHKDLPYKEFEVPSGFTSETICMESGMLAGELCANDPRGNRTRSEMFVKGSQPTEICTVHQTATICSESGLIPSQYCPEETIVTRVGIVRPIPYDEPDREKISDTQYEINAEAFDGVQCTVHTHYQDGDGFENPEDPDDGYFDWPEQSAPPYDMPYETFDPNKDYSTDIPGYYNDYPTDAPTETEAPPEVTLRP